MAYSGTQADSPLASLAIDKAFSGHSSGGEEVLTLLKGIVRREAEWLAPAETA